jgi:hypothetical protein
MGKLKVQNPAQPDEYFVGCFISRLKDHIKIPLRSHNPSNLVQAYALARNYEAYQHRRNKSDNSRSGYRFNYQSKLTTTLVKKEDTEPKEAPATRWEKGKCFKCQEPWVLGHNRVYKFRNQVHLIAIQDEDTSNREVEPQTDQGNTQEDDLDQQLQISMHAISSTVSAAKTFPLFVTIGTMKLVALIDSGSSTRFMDPSVVVKGNLLVHNHDPIKVTVANGNILWT